MQKNRAGVFLSLIAAISLAMFVILFAGYFVSLTVGRIVILTSPLSRADFLSIGLAQGRFISGAGSVAPAPPGFAPGFTWRVRPRKPDFRRSIREFDARTVSVAGGKGFIFAFPIWCVLPPCLIAPLLWLRKHRRPQPVGFDVIAASK